MRGLRRYRHSAKRDRRGRRTPIEPMSTALDTTTVHTTPEEYTTHVTSPTQEQQEGHGPVPPSAAPSNSDCKSTVSVW